MGLATSTEAEVRRVLDTAAVAIGEIVARNKKSAQKKGENKFVYPVITLTLSDVPSSQDTGGGNKKFVE